MLRDNNATAAVRDAVDGVVVVGVTVTELTETCWRSKRGLVGLRARRMARVTARRRRRRRDRRRKRKQQQPFRDGEDDEDA